MTMNTQDELKALLVEKFELDPATLDANAPLSEYGLDSLSLAELLFAVEDHFHIDFPDTRSDVNTLSELAALIDRLRLSKAA